MPGWEMKIIEAEAQRLLSLAAEDAELRADLRALARAILAATEAPQAGARLTESSADEEAPVPPAAKETGAGQEPDPANPGTPQADQTQSPEPLHELTLGAITPGNLRAPSACRDDHRDGLRGRRPRRDRGPLPAQGRGGTSRGVPPASDSGWG